MTIARAVAWSIGLCQYFQLWYLSLQFLTRWSMEAIQEYVLRYNSLALFISIPQVCLSAPTPLSLFVTDSSHLLKAFTVDKLLDSIEVTEDSLESLAFLGLLSLVFLQWTSSTKCSLGHGTISWSYHELPFVSFSWIPQESCSLQYHESRIGRLVEQWEVDADHTSPPLGRHHLVQNVN